MPGVLHLVQPIAAYPVLVWDRLPNKSLATIWNN